MKRTAIQLVAIAALTFSATFIFSGCESDLTDMANVDDFTANAITRDATTNTATNTCDCIINNFLYEELSDEEAHALLFMREEEKLARDVYLTLFEKWNEKIFSNIANSEQKHSDAVLCLIEKYDLTDPVGDNPIGYFEDAVLADLYNALVADGNKSLENALRVGATIEDLDISDLLTEIEIADNEDIDAVFSELMKGSRNHLRAFTGKLDKLGFEPYNPVYITQELFDEILSTPQESGSSICGDQTGPNKPGKGKNKPTNGPKGKGGPQ